MMLPSQTSINIKPQKLIMFDTNILLLPIVKLGTILLHPLLRHICIETVFEGENLIPVLWVHNTILLIAFCSQRSIKWGILLEANKQKSSTYKVALID